MSPREAVIKASELVGSQSALAEALGVRPPTVNQWLSGSRPVPPARAVQIEKMVSGEVSRCDLCPAFPWDVESETKNVA